jgi:hypothetical protein
MDPSVHDDDSTSNHSDSSSTSSANTFSRPNQSTPGPSGSARSSGIQSVQYERLMSHDDQDRWNKESTDDNQGGPSKRVLITKNTGSGHGKNEKRKRSASASGNKLIKREPQSDINDEVSSLSLSLRVTMMPLWLVFFRRIPKSSVHADVEPLKVSLVNAMDRDACSKRVHRQNTARTSAV